MKKISIILPIVILIGVSFIVVFNNTFKKTEEKEIPEAQIVNLYKNLIDLIMNEEQSMNTNAKYIALDLNSFKLLSEESYQEILEYTKKYHEVVYKASFADLEASGKFNKENLSIEGILLTINNFKIEGNEISLELMKYRSGLGSIGSEYVATYKNEKWNIESKGSWVSYGGHYETRI